MRPGCSNRSYHLHGKKDPVILCPSAWTVTQERAGNLLAMTHVDETVECLREVKSRIDMVP